MAKKRKTKKKRNVNRITWAVAIACLALVLVGLGAYLISDHTTKKRAEAVEAGAKAIIDKKLGEGKYELKFSSNLEYSIYNVYVYTKEYNDIYKKANEGDEEAAKQWETITEEWKAVSNELEDMVQSKTKSMHATLYLMDGEDNKTNLLFLYRGSVLVNAVKSGDETTG